MLPSVLMLLDFAASGVSSVDITPDGIDFVVVDCRPHYSAADTRPHYAATDTQPHYGA